MQANNEYHYILWFEVNMSYTALYRKFRPDTFEEVKGQDHIVNTLKNQIKAERIGHAYLFCGTRGTGKTSVAKIFARAVNCENSQDGSPCNECATCKAIGSGSAVNIVEMDAASNRGVDDIRQVIDEVQYSPSVGRYTVYIIDEVHMLTKEAFNALLKTLEEPPSHVIFILATTEPHKIPITILSRCQRYDFKRITIDTIAARLAELMDREEIEAEEKALRFIAKTADGSMRDAISMLDQCIAFYIGQKLTYDNVLEVLGAVDQEIFSKLYSCIVNSDVVGSMQVLDEVIMQGRELGQFVNDFIWYLRNIMIVQSVNDASDIIDVSKEQLEQFQQEAQMMETEAIMRYIRVLSELSVNMRYSNQKRVLLEIALVKLNQPEMENNNEALVNRIAALENKIKSGNINVNVQPRSGNPVSAPVGNDSQPVEEAPAKPLPKAIPEDVKYIADNWKLVLSNMDSFHKAITSMASLALKDDKLVLLFENNEIYYDMAREKNVDQIVNDIIKNEIGKDMTISLEKVEGNAPGTFFQKLIDKINYDIEEEDF